MFASPRAVIHNVHFLLFCRRHFYENSWDDSSALKCRQFIDSDRNTCEAEINMFPLNGSAELSSSDISIWLFGSEK